LTLWKKAEEINMNIHTMRLNLTKDLDVRSVPK